MYNSQRQSKGYGFFEQLRIANIHSGLIDLATFYSLTFRNVAEIIKVEDKVLQVEQGIDTIVVFKNGKRISFDEKFRSKDYGDILLEEISVWRTFPRLNNKLVGSKEPITYPMIEQYDLSPGWTRKNSHVDYITYVFRKSKRVYFLPFLLLRRAFDKYYETWLKESVWYNVKGKKQEGRLYTNTRGRYHTTNIPVPIETLYKAMSEEATWYDKKQVQILSDCIFQSHVQMSLL